MGELRQPFAGDAFVMKALNLVEENATARKISPIQIPAGSDLFTDKDIRWTGVGIEPVSGRDGVVVVLKPWHLGSMDIFERPHGHRSRNSAVLI